MSTSPSIPALSLLGRRLVLAAAFLGWLFAGVQMALIPLTSRAAAFDLLFSPSLPTDTPLSSADETQLGQWFARYIAAYLLGAAIGGLLFGWLGDRAGRVRAMGLSILTYSVLTGVSAFSRSPEQLLVLRFLASLGI